MYKYIDENKEHLHTLNGKPLIGTSSVLSVIAKPLTWWASGLAVEKFGWLKLDKIVPKNSLNIWDIDYFICSMDDNNHVFGSDVTFRIGELMGLRNSPISSSDFKIIGFAILSSNQIATTGRGKGAEDLESFLHQVCTGNQFTDSSNSSRRDIKIASATDMSSGSTSGRTIYFIPSPFISNNEGLIAVETISLHKADYSTINAIPQAISAYKKLKEISNMDTIEYSKLLDEGYRAHSIKLADSASIGTDMHEELEKYVKACIDRNKGIPYDYVEWIHDGDNRALSIFVKWASENVSKFLWSEVNCFSEKYFIGGISDCGAVLKDGRQGIIDFKSSKEAYQSQFFQCGGYAIELEENGGFDKDGNKTLSLNAPIDFLAIFPFGAENPEPVFDFNVQQSKEAFLSALTLYKIINSTKIE